MRLAFGLSVAALTCAFMAGCSDSAAGGYPTPEVSVSDAAGSLVVGEGSELPADWPADIPEPAGLQLQSVINADDSEVALYLGPGNAATIGDEVNRKLEEVGYIKEERGADGVGSAVVFVNAGSTVTVNVDQTGTDAAITLTVKRPRT